MKRSMLAIALLTAFAATAQAQNFPSKPIRMIVPYAPGGGVDILARIVAAKLSDRLGVQCIVDNRAGGATVIGSEIVAKAAPDGYTILMTNAAISANPSLLPSVPYDAMKAFAPVMITAESYSVLVSHPSLPVKSVKELVAMAKARPGQLNYASAGDGSAIHLNMALFQDITGIDVTHIPYKGAGPALTDVLGGQILMMFVATPPVVPHVNSGRLRGLGVTSDKRLAVLPKVPTIAESGYPKYVMSNWYAAFAPAKTPAEVVTKLNTEMKAVLAMPDVQERMAALGAEPGSGAPQQLADRLRTETEVWAKVLKKNPR